MRKRHGCATNRLIRSPVKLAIVALAAAGFAEEARAGGQLTVLASFNGENGINPGVTLTQDAAGNFYGTTEVGGAYDSGTVFEVVKGTNTITSLASFNYIPNRTPLPSAVNVDPQGNIFGVTSSGGANGFGMVYEVVKGSGVISSLASFTGFGTSQNGAFPNGMVMDANGNLFGTTQYGGANGGGTLFEVVKGTNTITTVASFDKTSGETPMAQLTMDKNGNLYGATTTGGAYGQGTIFELAKGSGVVSSLASFNEGTFGGFGSLTLDSHGSLYGISGGGGAYGDGSLFELPSGSHSITTLFSFGFVAHGGVPAQGGLAVDANGNIFGATVDGGAVNTDNGTVFEFSNGTYNTLASFVRAIGTEPTGLIMDAQGNLYGTAIFGGSSNDGTVWEFSAASVPEPSSLAMSFFSIIVMSGSVVVSNRRNKTRRAAVSRAQVPGSFAGP
jgi:uncharacterized repeat protein (TIGR03803 family)